MTWGQRKREARRQWADLETAGYRQYVVREVLRRRDEGHRSPAKDVAFEMLEDVWFGTGFRRLANLAYNRTLTIGRAALRAGADETAPQRVEPPLAA